MYQQLKPPTNLALPSVLGDGNNPARYSHPGQTEAGPARDAPRLPTAVESGAAPSLSARVSRHPGRRPLSPAPSAPGTALTHILLERVGSEQRHRAGNRSGIPTVWRGSDCPDWATRRGFLDGLAEPCLHFRRRACPARACVPRARPPLLQPRRRVRTTLG